MFAITTLIFVIALSMFITKAATIALVHTGMSRERARFQARSAFSGAGFTTSESEVVVKHPVRRKIIMVLILLGNAGVVTAISSLILGFTGSGGEVGSLRNVFLLVLGASLLLLATRSDRLDRLIEKVINRMLLRFTDVRPRSFSKLMTVMEDYEVAEVAVDENKWLKDKKLSDLNLTDEGLLVLGIIRSDDTYIGVPRGRYVVEDTDRIIIYGKSDRVAALAERTDSLEGKERHLDSVESHEKELEAQDAEVSDAEK